MKAIDTSALLTIALDEPRASDCIEAIKAETHWIISAGTVAEALIVARRRDVGDIVEGVIGAGGVEIVPVTAASARLAADAYDRWGKGVHPAALNLGDCFAYALARERACPLLYIGDHFTRTDIVPALSAG
ncbi:type II toxin-antitoxin system VapC family toxin [Sphingomonas profundi]|uniref:type II toxin-antitoxin system VapC family toxin n=1 Tax=Alterirhizorhabdus profundi TaxID=2681549 RepID=UPI0012E82366|nr:type II toxin-antitoxin system VapC family toxin [Sphingomonas profundi]